MLAWADHTYAELCAIKAELLAKVPEGLAPVAAAALPLVTTTGNQLISVAAEAKAGQTVLVSGAFGGVGRSAVFYGQGPGSQSDRGRPQLEAEKSLGAHEVLALDDESSLNRTAPVDVVANAGAPPWHGEARGCVRFGHGVPPNAKDFPSIRTIAFVSKQDANTLSYMAAAVAAGKLVTPIDRRLPLKDAAAGHAAVEKEGIGKVLLLP